MSSDLASLIRDDIARKNNSSRIRGYDWWQLSDEDEQVFAIDPTRFRAMISAFHCYEAFMGITRGTEWDMLHEEELKAARADHPELIAEGFSEEGFTAFATIYSDLTMREAAQVYWKQQAYQLREGILTFRGERIQKPE